MTKSVGNVGDVVFYQFEEGTVKEMKDGRITEVKHGCILTSGHNLRVIPITDDTRKISRMYRNLDADIRAASTRMNLNWPELANYMENLWYANCIAAITYSKEDLKTINKEFKKFSKDIFKAIEKIKKLTVCNVSLFR